MGLLSGRGGADKCEVLKSGGFFAGNLIPEAHQIARIDIGSYGLVLCLSVHYVYDVPAIDFQCSAYSAYTPYIGVIDVQKFMSLG